MGFIPRLAAAASLAALTLGAVSAPASAQLFAGHPHHHHPSGWNGPEGYFLVYARACPDLREDFRDDRRWSGWRDRREDRRARRVLSCPPRAFEYAPSRRELRLGLTGERLRVDTAYYSRRAGGYVVDTRWGPVPVQIVRGRPRHHPARGWRY